MPLNLKSAEQVRNSVAVAQREQIKQLYKDASKQLSKEIKKLDNKTNVSSIMRRQQIKILKKLINNQVKDIGDGVNRVVRTSMRTIANEMSWCSVKWLKSVGFEVSNGFVSLPTDIVENIASGQIYTTGWSLSKAIWSDNQRVQQDAYSIVAKGIATNSSISEIADELEVYVNPDKRLPWSQAMYNGELIKVYNKQVDYCSQRLARTLSQHAYQQSYEKTVEKNPFIEATRWDANGSRVCPLCADRDGQIFKKGELPLDHPNGMCVMTPVMIGSDDQIIDNIVNWYKSPEGTYPEIDEFAESLGYKFGNTTKNVMNTNVANSISNIKKQSSSVKSNVKNMTSKLTQNTVQKNANVITKSVVDKMSRSKLESTAKQIFVNENVKAGLTSVDAESRFDSLINGNSTTYLRKYIKKRL